MTKQERETLRLLAQGYVKELLPEDVSLAARRAIEELDWRESNCCGAALEKRDGTQPVTNGPNSGGYKRGQELVMIAASEGTGKSKVS